MATWTAAYINDLPDSAFACLDKAGRHYPHHDASGKLDLPHLRAALSRVGDTSNTQCGKAHLMSHAKAAGVGDRQPSKARLVDDDAFALRIIPYGGPIPSPHYAKGMDLDGEYFHEGTDIKASWFKERPITWHHGDDPVMGTEPIGKSVDLHAEDDGWWETYWLEAGTKRRQLIDSIAAKVPLYGSSAPISRFVKVNGKTGSIDVWPHAESTLTSAPQNTLAVRRPAKAILSDFDSAAIPISAALRDVLAELDLLDSGLPDHPRTAGVAAAKAGGLSIDELIGELDAFISKFTNHEVPSD